MSKVKVPVHLVPGEDPSPGMQTASFLLCAHMVFPASWLCDQMFFPGRERETDTEIDRDRPKRDRASSSSVQFCSVQSISRV